MFFDDCFSQVRLIQLRFSHKHKGPFEKLVLQRQERNGLHVKVVVFTLTEVTLLGRVCIRHDRHVHRLKLSKYECRETGPVQIAGAPHVP